jgi:hypothetical protein
MEADRSVILIGQDIGVFGGAYRVTEGQKSYIEKIDIKGNTKTKDKVIRDVISRMAFILLSDNPAFFKAVTW